jgi:hypothetical protein
MKSNSVYRGYITFAECVNGFLQSGGGILQSMG